MIDAVPGPSTFGGTFQSTSAEFNSHTIAALKARAGTGASAEAPLALKIVVVGDAAVGKTSLVRRFCENAFDPDYRATVGLDFALRRYVVRHVPVEANVWDTAGQEVFRAVSRVYFRGAHAVIACFALNSPRSLANIAEWVAEVRRSNADAAPLVFICGTKADLPHTVPAADALAVAREAGGELWEASARTGDGVAALFDRVTALALDQLCVRNAAFTVATEGGRGAVSLEAVPSRAPGGESGGKGAGCRC